MDIEALADQSANTARLHRLQMPAAVRMVLKERGLDNRPDAEELRSKLLSKLGQRGAARRKKNLERKGRVQQDMFAAAEARGGDPED